MTSKEAYKVAETLAFVDYAPQWIVRRVDSPDLYHVLSMVDPSDLLGHLVIIENFIDPKAKEGGEIAWERASSHE